MPTNSLKKLQNVMRLEQKRRLALASYCDLALNRVGKQSEEKSKDCAKSNIYLLSLHL